MKQIWARLKHKYFLNKNALKNSRKNRLHANANFTKKARKASAFMLVMDCAGAVGA